MGSGRKVSLEGKVEVRDLNSRVLLD